jgi:type I restriction enzyme S subunit
MDVEQFLAKRFRGTWTEAYHLGLWAQYAKSGLADRHFAREITSGDEHRMWQRIWEMIVFRLLHEKGYTPTSTDHGPDFCIMVGSRRVFIECTAPEPTGLPAEWLAPFDWSARTAECTSVPFTEILLRWTAAIKEKYDKLEGPIDRRTGERRRSLGYLGQGIVTDDDCYVIAVDGRMLLRNRNLPEGNSRLPFAVEATLPVGPVGFAITEAGKISGEMRHTVRFSVKNRNNADVPTDSFLNPDYSGVSAVMGCTSEWSYEPNFKVAIAHNPHPRAKLPLDVFGSHGEDYVARPVGPDEYEIVLPRR